MSSDSIHPLLRRQLRQILGATASDDCGAQSASLADLALAPEPLKRLLALVSDSYGQFDRDLHLPARSLALSSDELPQANDRLRQAAAQQQVLDMLRQSARALLPDRPLSAADDGALSDLRALAVHLHETLQQRLQAEYRLADSERQMRSLVANIPGCVYRRLHDARPTMLFVSDAIVDAIGWPASDFVTGDRSLARQVHPQDRQGLMEAIDFAVATRTSFNVHYRFRHRDGSERWANERGQGVYDANGHLLYLDGVLFDRTEAQMMRRELDTTRQQLFDAVEALDIGVLMFDNEDRLIICNRKFRDWHPGCADALEPGTPYLKVLRAVYTPARLNAVHTPDGQTWEQHRESRFRALDQAPQVREMELDGRWYRVDDSRTHSGVTISLRTDITAEKQAMLALERARDEAQSASLAKTRFLANMSHELRTPLNAVIGAAQLIKSGSRNVAQRTHLVEAIERSGTNLLGLIENILDLSRIEVGEYKLYPEDFHLIDCVEAAVTTAAISARAKGLDLACIVEPNLPLWRHGDAARLRQILLNLLGNAVKFTQAGEVVVRVGSGSAPDEIRIEISDTGVGIDAPTLAFLFQPFRQAEEGANRRFGGSGLGLAIVHQLVEAMGGQITVQSMPGTGSCFALSLVLPPAHATWVAPRPLDLSVAYVESHDPSAEALHNLLLRMGCAVQRCQSVAELRARCLAQLPLKAPSWVLVCADCPQSEEMHALAGALIGPQQVVGMTRIESRAVDLGDGQYPQARILVKPVSSAALVSRLLSSRNGVATPLQGSDPSVLATRHRLPTHVLVVEDDPLNQAIVGEMLRNVGIRVSVASSGKAALDALHTHSYDLVLMDWQMPDLDGLEVTRRLRAGAVGPLGQVIPIVALTANAFAEDRDACLAAGMNDFLSKPVLAASLVAAIDRLLPSADHTKVPAAEGRTGPSGDEGGGVPVFDPSVLAALPMVADGSQPDFAVQVLRQFVDSLPRYLSTIADALDHGDRPALQRSLHTLKSSAAAVGAMALSRMAERAEASLRAGNPPAMDQARQMQKFIDALALELGPIDTLSSTSIMAP
ncbi:MAG: response regulator [Rhodoferax sp.]|nr:response regulator [Rhodoferax sp.]